MSDQYSFIIPKGHVRFASIYDGTNHGNTPYALSVPVDLCPDAMVQGVRVYEGKDTRLVTLKTKFRVEVQIDGVDEDDPAGWDWLEKQHRICELRNMGRDGIFKMHPVRVTGSRYEYSSHGQSGYALALHRVALVAELDV